MILKIEIEFFSQSGGSPFLQRGRFSVIPEEGQETAGSPQTQTKLNPGPTIVVEEEWDFVSIYLLIFFLFLKICKKIHYLKDHECSSIEFSYI